MWSNVESFKAHSVVRALVRGMSIWMYECIKLYKSKQTHRYIDMCVWEIALCLPCQDISKEYKNGQGARYNEYNTMQRG